MNWKFTGSRIDASVHLTIELDVKIDQPAQIWIGVDQCAGLVYGSSVPLFLAEDLRPNGSDVKERVAHLILELLTNFKHLAFDHRGLLNSLMRMGIGTKPRPKYQQRTESDARECN